MAKYGMFEQVWLIKPWLSWHLTTNTGAAWSLFAGNSFVLSFVSIAMAALLIIVWWGRFRFHEPMTWALGAIVGGALGNFIDRFRLREVVDFIDVRIPWLGHIIKGSGPHYDFPIFNIADSAAVVGTLGLAVYLISTDIRTWRRRRSSKTQQDFKPIDEGLRLDESAVEKLKTAASRKRQQLPVRTDLGLTVHVSAPPVDSKQD
jgi:signal peptidase II